MRVAVLCSFNLDLIKQPLADELVRRGMESDLYFSGYSQWETDALDPESELHKFDPDLVILFTDMNDVVPPLVPADMLWRTDTAAVTAASAWQRTWGAARRLLVRDGRTVIVHTHVPSPHGALGLLEGNAGFSYASAAEAFNQRLREQADNEPRLIVLDYQRIVLEHGWDAWHDDRLWYLGRMRLSRAALAHLAVQYARTIAALRTPRRKCLVLDLDNTLWGGIIGEDGIEGIEIGHEGIGLAYRELQLAALALSQRGIILAVCSKNNPDDAIDALQSHPEMILRPENFATMQIGWDPKSEAIRRIAGQLNIGLDSLVFWDDDPREREIVRSNVPEVLVPEVSDEVAGRAAQLLALECFDIVALTDEDRHRGEMYRQQVDRERLLDETPPENLQAYYHSLETKATLREADDVSIRRIAQLTQRTNQFNCTTRRYSEADVQRMSADPAWRVYGLNVSDRFGDLGLIGAAIVESGDKTWRLDTLLLSCRALGRGVETAFLAKLNDLARAAGARLEGEFAPTKKNGPARKFLDSTGIELKETGSQGLFRFCPGAHDVTMPDWIQMHEEPASG